MAVELAGRIELMLRRLSSGKEVRLGREMNVWGGYGVGTYFIWSMARI